MAYEQIEKAARYVAERTGRRHQLAITLGSGLRGYAEDLPDAITMSLSEIPHFPVPGVAGHGDSLVSVPAGDGHALVFSGRVHLYEGRALAELVFGTRMAVLHGCETIILTNASGGCGPGIGAGDLVLITDHLNLTGQNPLMGPNDDRLGPRFPDMSDLYAQAARSRASKVAAETGTALKEGVYAWFTGPSYETPAEVEMARRMGADLVGMSTVPEAIAARHMGATVLAISLVTNLAAGMTDQPLSHDEVTAAGAQARDRFGRLVDGLRAEFGTA